MTQNTGQVCESDHTLLQSQNPNIRGVRKWEGLERRLRAMAPFPQQVSIQPLPKGGVLASGRALLIQLFLHLGTRHAACSGPARLQGWCSYNWTNSGPRIHTTFGRELTDGLLTDPTARKAVGTSAQWTALLLHLGSTYLLPGAQGPVFESHNLSLE